MVLARGLLNSQRNLEDLKTEKYTKDSSTEFSQDACALATLWEAKVTPMEFGTDAGGGLVWMDIDQSCKSGNKQSFTAL